MQPHDDEAGSGLSSVGRVSDVRVRFEDQLKRPIDGVQIWLLVGAGGSGKSEVLRQLAELAAEQVVYLPPYEFFLSDNFRASSIEHAIIAATKSNAQSELFSKYEELRGELSSSRINSVKFVRSQQITRLSFVHAYNRLAAEEQARGRPIVLLFDSAERAIDLTDAAADTLAPNYREPNWGGAAWLTYMLPRFQNTLAVIAGSDTIVSHPFMQFDGASSDVFQTDAAEPTLPVVPTKVIEIRVPILDQTESAAYLDRWVKGARASRSTDLRQAATQLELDPATLAVWHSIAQGAPFWLGMLLTAALLDRLPPQMNPLPVDDQPDTDALRAALIHELFVVPAEADEPLVVALQWMTSTIEGLSRDLLAALVEASRLSMNIRTIVRDLTYLPIVRQISVSRQDLDTEEQLLYLHNEAVRQLDARGQRIEPRWMRDTLTRWYTEQIVRMNTERQEVINQILDSSYRDVPRQLRTQRDNLLQQRFRFEQARLSYYFRYNTVQAMQEYNVVSYNAIVNRNYGYNIALRQEALRNLYQIHGALLPYPIIVECAARWILRAAYTDQRWVESMMQVIEQFYKQEAQYPGMHFAFLRLAEAQARLIMRRQYDERPPIVTLLEEAANVARRYAGDPQRFPWDNLLQAQIDYWRGMYHEERYEFESAVEYFRRSISAAQRQSDLSRGLQAQTQMHLAYGYSEQGDSTDARRFGLEALGRQRALNSEYYIGESCIFMARIEIRAGRPRNALRYAENASDLLDSFESDDAIIRYLMAHAEACRKVAEDLDDDRYWQDEYFRRARTDCEKVRGYLVDNTDTNVEDKAPQSWCDYYQQSGVIYRSMALALVRTGRRGKDSERYFALAHEALEHALAIAVQHHLPQLMQIDICEDLAAIHVNEDAYDHRTIEHLDRAMDCVPNEYCVAERIGLRDVPNPVNGFWRELGQCELQRMMLAFGIYEKGLSPRTHKSPADAPLQIAKGNPTYLDQAGEHLMLMTAYLLKYARSSWMLQKAEQLALRELQDNHSEDDLDRVAVAAYQTARRYNLINSEALSRVEELILKARRDRAFIQETLRGTESAS